MKKIFILIVVIILLSFSQVAFASSDYYIKNYEVNIKVNENATYEISEIIDVYFNEPRHGIFRIIPTNYSNQRAIIKNVHINENYSTTKTLNDVTYKIGDSDITHTGDKRYIISYTYDVGDDNIPEFDQFYYNIIGTGWDTNIDNVKFNITFPKDFDENKIWLTSGTYGSTNSDKGSYTKLGYRIEGYATNLGPNEGLTIKVEFPEGYYIGSRDNTDKSQTYAMIGWVLCVGLLVLLYLLWVKYGKDKKIYTTVQFKAPKDMTSAEVGYAIDGVVDNKDITSLIIYWADKGYLSIKELKRNKFEFERLKENIEGKQYEKKMFDSFFALGINGIVTTDDLKQKFYTELPGLKQLVKWEFKGEKELFSKKAKTLSNISLLGLLIPILSLTSVMFSGLFNAEVIFTTIFTFIFAVMIGLIFKGFIKKWHLFSKSGKLIRVIFSGFIMLFITIFIFFTLYIIKETYYQSVWTFSFILGETFKATVTIFGVYILSGSMEKRTPYGHEILEKLLGLREFIKTAEMDKLKMLSDENPEYFYNILPYATVLGLDKVWAKKFAAITIEPPNWYNSSYNRGFSSLIFYSHFNSFQNVTNSSMQMPKSSSSSMGGGGFSGGGVGGGGGGSW